MSEAIILTGVTGQIGAFVAKELLSRGCFLYLIVRRAQAKEQVAKIFNKLGVVSNNYQVIEADLQSTSLPTLSNISAFIHLAANITYDANSRQAIWQDNVDGTKAMLAWADTISVHSFHYVSSAYIAGDYRQQFSENNLNRGQQFHNVYEQSKLSAEKLVRIWYLRKKIPVKIYRPGNAMGASTGETLYYKGYYEFLKIISNFASTYRQQSLPRLGIGKLSSGLLQLPIRLEGNGAGLLHLVPVDYIAKVIAQFACQFDGPRLETLFLLPYPTLTNRQILEFIQEALCITGMEILNTMLPLAEMNILEQAIASTIAKYHIPIYGETQFDFAYSRQRLEKLGIPTPQITTQILKNWITYANQNLWEDILSKDNSDSHNTDTSQIYFLPQASATINKQAVQKQQAKTNNLAVTQPNKSQISGDPVTPVGYKLTTLSPQPTKFPQAVKTVSHINTTSATITPPPPSTGLLPAIFIPLDEFDAAKLKINSSDTPSQQNNFTSTNTRIFQDYFEKFLANFKDQLILPTLKGVVIWFIVDIIGDPTGVWCIQLDNGILRRISYLSRFNEVRKHVSFYYEVTQTLFADIIQGITDVHDYCMESQAKIHGDVKQAGKIAPMFHEFFQKNPYKPAHT